MIDKIITQVYYKDIDGESILDLDRMDDEFELQLKAVIRENKELCKKNL